MKPPRFAALALCGALTLALPVTARADEEGALAWGLLATEASTAGIFALNFGVKGWPNDGPALAVNFLPMVIGPGVGYLAHRGDFGPRPAYALHGASMIGLDLFMIGAMIDGRDEQDGLRIGTAAWTLGAVGTALGGWLGATQIEGTDDGAAFFGGPVGGLVVGGLVIGGVAALATADTNKASQRFMLGGTIGLSLGLAGSLIYAIANDDDDAAGAQPTSLPTVDASRQRIIFSFAGAF